MRRDMRRFSMWGGLVLLLVLVVMSGCSRSKSSGPPEDEMEGTSAAAVTPLSSEGTEVPAMSDEEATNATATALIVAATTAAQEATQSSEAEPSATAIPETTSEPVEATTPPEATSVTEEETVESQPTPTPEATTPPETVREASTYTVQAGDNLFRIALKYNLTYQALAAHNGIANPNLIFVGQELNIPAAGGVTPSSTTGGRYHTVQLGENLFRIALQNNMAFTTLAEANNLVYPYTIYPGQQLVIP
jgi:LysM repeat protein